MLIIQFFHIHGSFKFLLIKSGFVLFCFQKLSGSVVLIFFFSFLATPQHMEFPGQGSDPSHSCNPGCCCNNMRPLTHCAGPGIKPVSQRTRDSTNPTALRRGTPGLVLLNKKQDKELVNFLINSEKTQMTVSREQNSHLQLWEVSREHLKKSSSSNVSLSFGDKSVNSKRIS